MKALTHSHFSSTFSSNLSSLNNTPATSADHIITNPEREITDQKMRLLSSLFKNRDLCNHPRTLSFRAPGDDMFKTVNSMFLDPIIENEVHTPDSWFTNSSECESLSTESEGESLEMMVRGGRQSERLFFEPGVTSSILEEAKTNGFPFKESEVLAMESEDPYGDFRRSMEEMVQSHGLKDWECLQELLGWYLKVNGKNYHGLIVGAFVDLLIGIGHASSNSNPSSDSASFTSAVSSLSSSDENEIGEEEEEDENKLAMMS